MVIFIIICVVLVIACWALDKNDHYGDYPWFFGVILGGGGLLIALLMIFGNRYDVRKQLVRIESMRETLNYAREHHASDGEVYAITREIVEYNAWLRATQWENTGGYDICIPDEVMDVKPIE